MNKQEYEALRLCVASLDQLMPYLAKVPADVGLLNDALMAARPLLEPDQGVHCTAHVDYAPESRIPAPAQDERDLVAETLEWYAGMGKSGARARTALAAYRATRPAQTEQQPAFLLEIGSDGEYAVLVRDKSWLRAMRNKREYQEHKLYAAPIAQTAPQPEQSEPNRRTLQWVVDRWHAEVANRPLVNVHRRTLDSTWRQMIRHLGEDDVVLLGPRHDDMLDASGNPLPQYAAPIAQTAPQRED